MSTQPHTRRNPYKDPDAEEKRGRYYGEYQGFVRDRDDPDRLGRVRIHVPSLMGQENKPEAWSDWCFPTGPGLFVPPLNGEVWVTFEMGIVANGVYDWGWLTATPAAASAAGDPTWSVETSATSGGVGVSISIVIPADTAIGQRPKYPYNKVFKSEGGTTVELDDTPDNQRLRIRHPSGTTILIDPDGTVQVRSAGATCFESAGDFNIKLGQGASFKVVYPSGPSMVLGPAGFAVSSLAIQLGGRAVICGTPDPIK